jgi:hypothetical protein
VIEADDARVLVAMGVPPSADESSPRTVLKAFSRDAWARAANREDPPAGYWFVGSYEDGAVIAIPIESHGVGALSDADPLRFVARWAGGGTA